jgi:Ca2+-binding RTX toxin-like protein
MSKTYTISADTTMTVDAHSANTKYIVAEGVHVTAAGLAIDATSNAGHRSLEIDGYVSGVAGLQVGNQSHFAMYNHVTIGATGVLHGDLFGVATYGNHNSVTNNGDVGCQVGISTFGDNVAVTNSGKITATTTGIQLIGDHSSVSNSGTIDGPIGVNLVTYQTNVGTYMSTLHNSGTISGSYAAVQGGDGNDTVFNAGTMDGKVLLNGGNDIYQGKGGLVLGLVDGGKGNDVLVGGNNGDKFSGGIGHDVITGRGGADQFIFSTKFDADTITDFHAKGSVHDWLDLSNMKGFDNFGDLAGHMHEHNGDAVLNFGHGDVLTLHEVDFHDLSKADFMF